MDVVPIPKARLSRELRIDFPEFLKFFLHALHSIISSSSFANFHSTTSFMQHSEFFFKIFVPKLSFLVGISRTFNAIISSHMHYT